MPFNPKKFIEETIPKIKEQIGKEKAIAGISGGVDSTVASVLVGKAIGKNLVCVFVDTGLMRENETEKVEKTLKRAGINIKVENASDKFFKELKGITNPEEKRKIIGKEFIEVFQKIAKEEKVSFLVQGTIGPDWIESGGGGRDTIKSHHNVAGLPLDMKLKLCEPLRDLYKHEVRMVARELGLKEELSERQPFPGPALAVRVVGEVTPEKVEIVRKASVIVEEEIEKASEKKEIEKPWQYFAAMFPIKTVGVRGDERAYQYTIVIRAVRSLDGMTANFSHFPPKVLERISTRITNEIKEVGRVFYDITNKPPATIEME
ncbi:MAG: glutamine-hydrolyzing GMP synthase [Candidatus ainarchaeum sp.]|nr:glutamine-hydrolyzing GMP synthase [Candidatus ainarchaeum sp.]